MDEIFQVEVKESASGVVAVSEVTLLGITIQVLI